MIDHERPRARIERHLSVAGLDLEGDALAERVVVREEAPRLLLVTEAGASCFDS